MKRKLAAPLMALTMVCLSACGLSNGSGSGDTTKIMVISDWDNPSFDYQQLPTIVENAAGPVNKAGGINGKKIEVVSCNSKNDPNESMKCARKAVAEKVVSVVGGFNTLTGQIFPVLEAAKIPFVGGAVSLPVDYTSPMSFPITSGAMLFVASAVHALQNPACKSIGFAANQQSEPHWLPYVSKILDHAKVPIVSKAIYPPGTTDMAPYVTQLTANHPDCLILSWTTADAVQMIPALDTLGVLGQWKGRIYTHEPAGTTAQLVKQFPKETNGLLSDSYFPPISDPGWDEYKKVEHAAGNLGKYEDTLGDGSVERTYLAFKVFETVAKTIKGNITNGSMFDALNKACKVDIGSVAPVLNFCDKAADPNISRTFNSSFVWYKVENGEFTRAQPGFQDVMPAYRQATGGS